MGMSEWNGGGGEEKAAPTEVSDRYNYMLYQRGVFVSPLLHDLRGLVPLPPPYSIQLYPKDLCKTLPNLGSRGHNQSTLSPNV